MRIYVGNLPFGTTEKHLQRLFKPFGQVAYAASVKSGQFVGCGFVEMLDETQAQSAINKLDGWELDGQTIAVHQAH